MRARMHPPNQSGAAQNKRCGARPRNNDWRNPACRAARRPIAQCWAAELLAGGDSGSSMIENGNSDRLAWNEGAKGNAASRA